MLTFEILVLSLRRPTGVVGRGADFYPEGIRLESWVRTGCKTVLSFIAGNGDRISGASVIKWLPLLDLLDGRKSVT